MGWHFSLFLALIACGGKPEFPQSQPITETPELPKDSISVPMGSDAEKPTAVDLLTLRLPALQQLQQSEMEAVVASLNLVPSPCSMCPNRTVAHCLVDLGWTECRVLGKLANRAIRLAKDGQGVDQIKIAVKIKIGDLPEKAQRQSYKLKNKNFEDGLNSKWKKYRGRW